MGKRIERIVYDPTLKNCSLNISLCKLVPHGQNVAN